MRQILCLALLLFQAPPLLRDVVTEKKIDASKLPADLFNRPVSSFLIDDRDGELVLAFIEAGDGRTPPKAHILRRDTSSNQWKSADISEAIGSAGSLTKLVRTPRYVYLDAHITPSAGSLVALSRDLKVLGAMGGWMLTVLPGEGLLYHENQVHFASTHRLELSVFNPETQKSRRIYPPTPHQPARVAFIQRVADAYKKRGQDWFREHNHHMNPEWFDSFIRGDVTVDAAANVLRFSVQFGNAQNGNDPVDFSTTVAVTCGPLNRLDELTCSER
jgi:hypothetical protein